MPVLRQYTVRVEVNNTVNVMQSFISATQDIIEQIHRDGLVVSGAVQYADPRYKDGEWKYSVVAYGEEKA